MTSETEELLPQASNTPELSKAVEQTSEQPIVCDFFLQTMVKAVDTYKTSIGISLTVGGSIISGQLVGRNEYGRTVLKAIFPNSVATVLEAALFEPLPSGESTMPRMIHLKDAVIYTGTRTFKADWWRGRIEAVDGFNLGTFDLSKEPK